MVVSDNTSASEETSEAAEAIEITEKEETQEQIGAQEAWAADVLAIEDKIPRLYLKISSLY